MSLQYTVRPISDRTAFGGAHQYSLFTVKWHQVLDLLQREYEQLNGKHLVIEVDVDERHIRNDGLLRSDAKAKTPAVRIAFESKHGPIVMATDKFVHQYYRNASMDDWQHNVYAIAKSLEALRLVDRYGVTKRGEQYTGWKAIGAGTGGASHATDREHAELLEVLAIGDEGDARERTLSRLISRQHVDGKRIAREARIAAHPDRNGGDHDLAYRVDAAVRALGLDRETA